jgi:hypothetical protein
MSKSFLFFLKNNDVEYYIINCITTFQKEKQNWKQFQKQKRFWKRFFLLEAEASEAEASEAEAPEAEALRVGAEAEAEVEAEVEALRIQVLPHHCSVVMITLTTTQ